MDLGLAGRRAIVCASSKGLGRACAWALAAEGCEVVVNGRHRQTVAETAAAIRAAFPQAKAIEVPGDVTEDEGRRLLLAACPEPDILINNAGGPPPGDFRDWLRDDWLRALDANMLAAIWLIKASVDGMIARRFGRIVNITSAAVKSPIPTLGLSNGARAGLTGFCAGLARETVAHNVTVNSLLPGPFDTDRLKPGEAWRRIRTKARKPRQLAALRELAAWREETARRRDLPRNRVARDELLERIAIQRPASAADLQAIRLVPRGLAASRDGKAMLAAVGRAMALPEEALPRREAKEGAPNAPVALLELLKVLLRARCEREGVTPRLVASAADLERFAAATDGAAGPLASGWRHALFGRDALRLKRGQLALAPDGDGLKLIDLKPGQGAPGQ